MHREPRARVRARWRTTVGARCRARRTQPAAASDACGHDSTDACRAATGRHRRKPGAPRLGRITHAG
ncbi:hypothetical protein DN523_04550 [Burkholderia multivorans]|nr:hypothetical protein DN471_01215 [Burkholderia multivorans]RAA35977.1 hypothetical protein DN472_30225 [Burkholderia multivorans]RAA59868.1 hypothetical protein DN507_11150 [Burkholderia multivorans]RAA62982.1 hypothetical protein DN479_15945 [Burkholderia multivorans]RAA66532.1 hypothetical protein DN497_27540 [Burkholderia multivorans]